MYEACLMGKDRWGTLRVVRVLKRTADKQLAMVYMRGAKEQNRTGFDVQLLWNSE